MFVCSHQSVLLPWIGFWHKVKQCHVVIINSGSDFCRQDYEHRVKMKGAWLTLPLDKENCGKEISSIHIQHRSLRIIAARIRNELVVKRNKYTHRLRKILWYLEHTTETNVAEINRALLLLVAEELNIKTKFIFIDEIPQGGCKTSKLWNRMEPYLPPEAEYIAGGGAEAYLDPSLFPRPLYLQQVNSVSAIDCTILELMVKHEDPFTVVQDVFTYVPFFKSQGGSNV